jgi:hypothetical protein
MTPGHNLAPDPDFKLPVLDRWWLAPAPRVLELTREELDARRAEMAPWTFRRLDVIKGQERRIICMLESPGQSSQDRKHLISALGSIRNSISITLEKIAVWGLVRPPPT